MNDEDVPKEQTEGYLWDLYVGTGPEIKCFAEVSHRLR